MSDRKSLDRPASITAAVIGVLLIGISAILYATVLGDEDGAATYNVNWAEVAHTSRTDTQGAEGDAKVVNVPFADILASNVTLTIECTDNRGPGQLQPAATVTWTLTLDNETLGQGTSCGVDETYTVSGHPDVAETKAESLAVALAGLYGRDGFENRTGQATLTFTWNRAAGPPLVPDQSSFTATLAVGVLRWDATVSEQADDPEVVR